MGQDHRKRTDRGRDKLNIIRESERPLQKELPRPGRESKDGKEKSRKPSRESRKGYGPAQRQWRKCAYISGNRPLKDGKGRVLFWVEDNLDDGKGISTLYSTDQNLKKQRHFVEPHKIST